MNYELEIIELKKRIETLERLLSAKTEHAVKDTATSSNRDKTKYMFEGKVYPKNRLVLAIIKKYIAENPVSFAELNAVFDKSLQGSLGVIETYDDAQKISDAAKRYFMKDEDTLQLVDTKAVVCTQWGIFNIVKFVKRAEALGFNIETI